MSTTKERGRPTASRQLSLGFCAAGEPARTGRDLGTRHQVEYRELPCRSILNWVDGSRASGFFSVNPYRGCEFGCAYCYARYTHAYLEQATGAEFERRVYVKVQAPEALRADLRRKPVLDHKISFGSATDPYQPGERHFRLTRRLLEALLPFRGLRIGIVTKSALVERDAELLGELARRHRVKVLFSCITLDRSLQRSLEPRAPTPEQRFAAMARLRAAGVASCLMLAPVLPGITDSEEGMRAVCARAREAGATSVHAQVLFLPKASRPQFFGWLERNRPDLLEGYRRAYAQGRECSGSYRERLGRRLESAREATGFVD